MQADQVLYNGDIHTMDVAAPRARAIALAGNRILAVGDDAEMCARLVPQGRAVDLRGGTVVPGFIDAHLHFMSYGLSLRRIDLVGTRTPDEALVRVQARVAETPMGQWLEGRGWDHTLWPGGAFPTRHDLDRVAPDHPVFLGRKCGHAGWANSRALELAGITSETPDPPGGAIERDPETHQPTGILKDRAMEMVYDRIPPPGDAEARSAIQAAIQKVHQLGLVGVHTMEDAGAFRVFQQLHAAGELSLRVLMQITQETLDAAIQLGLRSGFGDERLRIGGVKLFSDGSLGARTAYLLEPYNGHPGEYGIPVATPEQLGQLVGKASRAGLAAFIHAIGDRANRMVLDAIEVSRQAGEGPALRHRIEHVQMLHPSDLPRLAQLRVIASMQPIHAIQDMSMADELWGPRAATAYAWRRILDSGAALAFGSDAPVEDLNVMLGIHAAVTRRRSDGSPGPNGWYPEQRLTVAQAVHAYTAGAAYAGGEEAIKGTLASGKLADLVVLSQDIFTIDPMAIPETRVVATLFDGNWVHGRAALS